MLSTNHLHLESYPSRLEISLKDDFIYAVRFIHRRLSSGSTDLFQEHTLTVYVEFGNSTAGGNCKNTQPSFAEVGVETNFEELMRKETKMTKNMITMRVKRIKMVVGSK